MANKQANIGSLLHVRLKHVCTMLNNIAYWSYGIRHMHYAHMCDVQMFIGLFFFRASSYENRVQLQRHNIDLFQHIL